MGGSERVRTRVSDFVNGSGSAASLSSLDNAGPQSLPIATVSIVIPVSRAQRGVLSLRTIGIAAPIAYEMSWIPSALRSFIENQEFVNFGT